MKPIVVDGKPHRMRRGKLVLIPEEWVGKTVHDKTIAQRPSKAPHKRRKQLKYGKRRREADEHRAKERTKDAQ
jgi:hypothetical protein